MKAPPFTYHRPASIDEALELLARHGDEAKVLAGGQSLVPLMGLRMGRPAHVVDIGTIDGLDRIKVHSDGALSLGALVRHEQAKRSTEVAQHAPLLAAALPWIGHRAIRTRGTVVGSIAHADPAAEVPAVALVTGATMTARSIRGSREISADEFFMGYLDTALADDEILTSVNFPALPPEHHGSVVEVARRHGDYALVGLVAGVTVDHGAVNDAALAFFGVASTPMRVAVGEQCLIGSALSPDTIEHAAAAVTGELDPPADIHASSNYRRHLAGVLTKHALTEVLDQIGVQA